MPFQLYQYCAFCSVQWQKTRGSVRKTRRLTLNWSDYFQVFFFFLRNDYFHVEYNHTSEIWPYGSDILIGGHMSLIMIYNLQFSNNNTCVNFFFFLRINTCVNYLLVFVHKIIIVFFIFLFYMYNLTLFSEIGMKTLFSKTINASQVWPCHQFKKKKKMALSSVNKIRSWNHSNYFLDSVVFIRNHSLMFPLVGWVSLFWTKKLLFLYRFSLLLIQEISCWFELVR